MCVFVSPVDPLVYIISRLITFLFLLFIHSLELVDVASGVQQWSKSGTKTKKILQSVNQKNVHQMKRKNSREKFRNEKTLFLNLDLKNEKVFSQNFHQLFDITTCIQSF